MLPTPVNSRLVLMAGFGGLLLVMLFAEFDGVQALREIQSSNDAIREDFLLRTRLLERIRGDVYVSGTFVRDYLLEPESGKAEGHRYSLLETRNDMDAALQRYSTLANRQEREPFHVLQRELAAYWNVLEPVFQWAPEQRQRDGYVFLRDEVFPRRQAMLAIADQIGSINESQLNAGKQLAEQTYARFRRRLTIILALTVSLGVILAMFTIRTSSRYVTEIEAARAQLKQLSARLVEVQENERRRISRELHDEVGQELTGVLVEMANLSTLVRAGDLPALSIKADEIKKEVENSISVVRNMALLLRPSMLDDLGLVPALEWQAREVFKRTGVHARVKADGVSEDLPEEHKTCVYRLVQEALHNCVQHAGAKNVNIEVAQLRDSLRLAIHDDGKGFNPAVRKGMGLVGMQERVWHLGGTFAIDSHPGSGTAINVALPLVEAA
ncbi:MAG TPA: histidine kinase [Candidatus Limnocylindrales bacterium]|nr:histidine kinase [Candidatus Limnocylindrales bacterium]